MSASTLTRSTVSRRHVRKLATLTLDVNGVPYRVFPFDIDSSVNPDGNNPGGYEHALAGPDGERFRIWGDYRWSHCEKCGHGGCEHAVALREVDLL